MAKAQTIKPEEQFARSYADRLILEQLYEIEAVMKLSELADKLSHAGLGLAAVRSLLASNPERFAYHERRWVPTARIDGAGRPNAETVRLIVDRFGGPMPLNLVVREMARIWGVDDEQSEATIRRIADSSPDIVLTEREDLALTVWGFYATDESHDRAFRLWNIDLDQLAALEKNLGNFDWRAKGAIKKALQANAPVSLRLLGAAAWKNLNPDDPRAILLYDAKSFLSEALSVEGFIYGADGVVYPEADAKKWLSLAVKVADKLAPTIDVEDAAPVEVKAEEVAKMIKKIVDSDATVTASKLLEEIYEITPSNKTYPDDLINVITALQAESKVWWVGADRFRKPNSAPDFIEAVPEPFVYVETEFKDAEGELIDTELTDDGLSSSLRKLLQHPLAMDVLDEDIAPAPKNQAEQIRLVLKSIHRELGTFPMAQIPGGFIPSDPQLQELVFIDPQGRELQVWANQDARLLFNLIDWWYEQPVESGAVFTLTKTPRPNVFEFAWDEQTDPVVFISSQRMEELRQIQERLEEMSTLDLLIEVMSHWPKGADFLTLLAEVNVVRRTTRRLLASLLSSYQCFYQRSGSPVWHFDNKKIELGFDKSKRKFVKK